MRILVLVDGSKWSQKAALHAFSVAKKKGAKVVLFSVLDRKEAQAIAVSLAMRSGDVEKLKKFEETAWKEMKKGIHDVISALLELGQREGINCSFRIVEGNAREKVLEEANSGKYSLVVMGAYGKSGKTRIGSLLEDVVGVIKPPVMIVR
ncbi:universal stress protein [Thermococcus kodakarensis KOD1]|uniref:Universal stress protein n=1 Tax=Thermococcus kodakarensis (strain ATCC BAA-918 / JCM 12380 / KOD1) TaxID=69014 RepID=Q5JI39_THEKO|nr:universal stress protein [Thermococcus kodakarensis]WCN28875.1 universal stress protein [Thermococcus kodakarensis]WCN31178.1 universal stress protein [Thermococcus kodakarensis]BAD85070.1 universal stress protein [Thermococcus kodakarensis KOD1]